MILKENNILTWDILLHLVTLDINYSYFLEQLKKSYLHLLKVQKLF